VTLHSSATATNTMLADDIVWHIINHGFCSFKTKTETQTFCRNEYNVTGLCSRRSCPLANSRYATVLEKDGTCYLYVKTPERSHTPAKMWEVTELSNNYSAALKQIDNLLIYWPKWIKHKCKQRFTKITQYLIRLRTLRSKVRKKIIHVNKKVERREARRESKAEAAAKLDMHIKQELLERLKQGTYGEIYNFPPESFQEALDEQQIDEQPEDTEDVDLEDLPEFLPEWETNEFEQEEEVISNKEDERMSSSSHSKKRKVELTDRSHEPKTKRKRTHIEIEYEEESAQPKQVN
jgi:protein MAK16